MYCWVLTLVDLHTITEQKARKENVPNRSQLKSEADSSELKCISRSWRCSSVVEHLLACARLWFNLQQVLQKIMYKATTAILNFFSVALGFELSVFAC
jgi:hypothetical protein